MPSCIVVGGFPEYQTSCSTSVGRTVAELADITSEAQLACLLVIHLHSVTVHNGVEFPVKAY